MRTALRLSLAALALLEASSFAAGPYFNPNLVFQGLLRASPTTYVPDGAYCAQLTLNRAGAITWQKKISNFSVTDGVFSVALSGLDDSGTALSSSLFQLLTSNSDQLTVDVKIDYSSSTCSASPTFDDTFTSIPIYAVPTAMVADRCNTLTGTVSGSQVAGPLPLSVLDVTGAANGDVMTFNGTQWTHAAAPSGSSLSGGSGPVTI